MPLILVNCTHCKKIHIASPRARFCCKSCAFHANVESRPSDPNQCWLWNGKRTDNGKGYGYVSLKGEHCRSHKLSYELFNAPIPKDQWVLHSCHNPGCVNPSHLRLGSPFDNAQDRVKANRNGNTRGINSGSTHLTEAEVLHIYNSATCSQVLANKYNVARQTIRAIRNGQNWSHLTNRSAY